MDKELFIKTIIGSILEPEGFFYQGREQECSHFFRRVKNEKGETIRQKVSIQDEYEERLILFFDSAYSKRGRYYVDDIIPGYPGVQENSFYYHGEKEFKEVIETYAYILREYGISLLEKLKEVQIGEDFTDEDVEKLYYHHKQLVENILKRENRRLEEFDVKEVAEFIEKKIEEVKEESFHNIKELLLELSGLFGAVANQFYPCEWTLKEYITLSCDLEFPESKKIEGEWYNMSVLSILQRGWERKRIKDNGILKDKGILKNKGILNKGIKKKGIKEELLLQYGYCTQKMEIVDIRYLMEKK